MGKKHQLREVFVDGIEGQEHTAAEQDAEQDADTFAADFLVSPQEWRQFVRAARFSQADVQAFAQRVGIAPGIVVGRLQHEGKLANSRGNQLKRGFTLDD